MTSREEYTVLEKKWENCKKCPIGRWAYRHCFGAGNLQASYVFIGEGPGASEDAIGTPFVGPAGRLFQKALELAGYHPEDWFLTNLVACRPTDEPNGPNRAPNADEVLRCSPRLMGTLRIVQPKVVVAVGSVPASYLVGTLGQIQDLNAVYARIKHPAWVLRQGGELSEAFCDFVDALKKIRRLK